MAGDRHHFTCFAEEKTLREARQLAPVTDPGKSQCLLGGWGSAQVEEAAGVHPMPASPRSFQSSLSTP